MANELQRSTACVMLTLTTVAVGCSGATQTQAEQPPQSTQTHENGQGKMAQSPQMDTEGATKPAPSSNSDTPPTDADQKPPEGRVVSGSPCPAYPRTAQAQGVEGDVVVRYVVQKDGVAKNVEAKSGPEALHQACVDSVTYATFVPKTENGQAVEAIHEKTCRFRLPADHKSSTQARPQAPPPEPASPTDTSAPTESPSSADDAS